MGYIITGDMETDVEFFVKDRPSREKVMMQVAFLIATRATCARASQGAILVKGKRIISTGYNGPLPGLPHCNNQHCDLSKACTRAVHAEINAILYAARVGITVEGADLFCTTIPCKKCAEAVVQAGVKRVYYANVYRDDEGGRLLREAGVEVIQIKGYENGLQDCNNC